MQDIALAYLVVRAPLAIVNLVQCFVVDPATTLLLTVLEIAQIYVPEERVDQAALATPTILLPTALVDRSVKLNQLTDAVSNELLMLSEINISVAVKQLTNWLKPTFHEITLVNQVFTTV
jgi:hypothetical protein